MTSQNAVYIFTKDRPGQLSQIFSTLSLSGYLVFLIDDSKGDQFRTYNSALCKRHGVVYYGIPSQVQLINDLYRQGIQTNGILKVLGDDQWNLGYARNHALCITKMKAFKKSLFLDDDIKIDLQTVKELFEGLDTYGMVASKIVGMPDDSVVGHIAAAAGWTEERVYSGGCLAFSEKALNTFFLNVYNEDWIWQYFQPQDLGKLEIGSVVQESYDPFLGYHDKIIFQEMGEIIIDGIQGLLNVDSTILLGDTDFWKVEIMKRKEYLKTLKSKCQENQKHFYEQVLNSVLANYRNSFSEEIALLFSNFRRMQKSYSEINEALVTQAVV